MGERGGECISSRRNEAEGRIEARKTKEDDEQCEKI